MPTTPRPGLPTTAVCFVRTTITIRTIGSDCSHDEARSTTSSGPDRAGDAPGCAVSGAVYAADSRSIRSVRESKSRVHRSSAANRPTARKIQREITTLNFEAAGQSEWRIDRVERHFLLRIFESRDFDNAFV